MRATRQPASGSGKPTALEAPRQPASPLWRAVKCWLDDGRSAGWTDKTINGREQFMSAIIWWLENECGEEPTLTALNTLSVRAFLSYLREDRAEGRFGRKDSRTTKEARPATRHAYYRVLRAFGNWCVENGLIESSWCEKVKPPQLPKDRRPPLYGDQIRRLLDATRRGSNPERDVAIVLVLLDTGLRVSELVSLNCGDFARASNELTVTGKGGKRRQVYMDAETRKALWKYREVGRFVATEIEERRDRREDDPLFVSAGGHSRGKRLTINGIFQMIQAHGKAAGIEGVGPHDLRRTFAVNFLRGGGNLFELQRIMGHTDLTVLREYVELADTDLSDAHRKASPVKNLRLK